MEMQPIHRSHCTFESNLAGLHPNKTFHLAAVLHTEETAQRPGMELRGRLCGGHVAASTSILPETTAQPNCSQARNAVSDYPEERLDPSPVKFVCWATIFDKRVPNTARY